MLTDAEILDIVLDNDDKQTEEPGEIPQTKDKPTSNQAKEAVVFWWNISKTANLQ